MWGLTVLSGSPAQGFYVVLHIVFVKWLEKVSASTEMQFFLKKKIGGMLPENFSSPVHSDPELPSSKMDNNKYYPF